MPGDTDRRTGMHLSEKAQCGIPETAKENTATYREVSSDGEKYPAGNPGRTGRCFHFRLRGKCFKEGRNPITDAGFPLRA